MLKFAPPPTKFGPQAPAQAKPAAAQSARPAHAPPPTKFGTTGMAQAKVAAPRPKSPSSAATTIQPSKWRTGSLDTEIHAATLTSPGMDSGHHKISKSALGNFVLSLPTSDQLKIAKAVKGMTTSAPLTEKEVKSLRSLVKVGPQSSLIVGDPGDDIDPTYDTSGRMTPRSREWVEVDKVVQVAKKSGYTGITGDQIKTVIKHITNAESAHSKKMTSGKIDPDTSMWVAVPGGKYKQRGPRKSNVGWIIFLLIIALIIIAILIMK